MGGIGEGGVARKGRKKGEEGETTGFLRELGKDGGKELWIRRE